jgi:hypothetical protein
VEYRRRQLFPSQSFTFTMSEGLTLTATFVSNSLPTNSPLLLPAQRPSDEPRFDSRWQDSVVGRGAAGLCQVFEDDAPLTGFLPATVHGNKLDAAGDQFDAWATYTAVAMATDADGTNDAGFGQVLGELLPGNIAGAYHGLFFDPAAISGTNAGAVSFTL